MRCMAVLTLGYHILLWNFATGYIFDKICDGCDLTDVYYQEVGLDTGQLVLDVISSGDSPFE